MAISKYIRSDSADKKADSEFMRSRTPKDYQDEALQDETRLRKGYVMQPPSQRMPEITLEAVDTREDNTRQAKEGATPASVAIPLRNRDEAELTGFESQMNVRKKFINVSEVKKTPGAIIRERNGYNYPNKSEDAQW